MTEWAIKPTAFFLCEVDQAGGQILTCMSFISVDDSLTMFSNGLLSTGGHSYVVNLPIIAHCHHVAQIVLTIDIYYISKMLCLIAFV